MKPEQNKIEILFLDKNTKMPLKGGSFLLSQKILDDPSKFQFINNRKIWTPEINFKEQSHGLLLSGINYNLIAWDVDFKKGKIKSGKEWIENDLLNRPEMKGVIAYPTNSGYHLIFKSDDARKSLMQQGRHSLNRRDTEAGIFGEFKFGYNTYLRVHSGDKEFFNLNELADMDLDTLPNLPSYLEPLGFRINDEPFEPINFLFTERTDKREPKPIWKNIRKWIDDNLANGNIKFVWYRDHYAHFDHKKQKLIEQNKDAIDQYWKHFRYNTNEEFDNFNTTSWKKFRELVESKVEEHRTIIDHDYSKISTVSFCDGYATLENPDVLIPYINNEYHQSIIPWNHSDIKQNDLKYAEFVSLLTEIIGPNQIDLLLDRIATNLITCLKTLSPHIFYSYGPGGNGKSTVNKIVERLFGLDNVVNVEPSKLSDNFGKAVLIRKLALNCNEMGGDMTKAWTALKSVIEYETISVNRKHIPDSNYYLYATVQANANVPLSLIEWGLSATRRIYVLDFNKTFVKQNPTSAEIKKSTSVEDFVADLENYKPFLWMLIRRAAELIKLKNIKQTFTSRRKLLDFFLADKDHHRLATYFNRNNINCNAGAIIPDNQSYDKYFDNEDKRRRPITKKMFDLFISNYNGIAVLMNELDEKL